MASVRAQVRVTSCVTRTLAPRPCLALPCLLSPHLVTSSAPLLLIPYPRLFIPKPSHPFTSRLLTSLSAILRTSYSLSHILTFRYFPFLIPSPSHILTLLYPRILISPPSQITLPSQLFICSSFHLLLIFSSPHLSYLHLLIPSSFHILTFSYSHFLIFPPPHILSFSLFHLLNLFNKVMYYCVSQVESRVTCKQS